MWGEGLELGSEPRSLLTTKPVLVPLLYAPGFLWEQVVKILSHRSGQSREGPRSRVRAAVAGSLLSLPLARECFHSRMVLAFKFMLQGWPRAHWRVMTSLWY